MKNVMKNLTLGLIAALSLSAEATSPIPPVQPLAVITQSAGLQFDSPNAKIFSGRTFEIFESGKVTVTSRYHKRGKEIIEVNNSISFKAEDMATYKKSIAQLKFDRPLVIDQSEPIMCDGGSTHYKVYLKGELVTLQENNDCTESRSRQGRSNLEVQVIKVMSDLVEFYYRSQH
jgi:hypothetical protein